jgi:Na+:H+ antiporter, NhaA family
MRARPARFSTALRDALHYVAEHALVLPAGAIVALVWANANADSYTRFAHALEFPVNDIGMVFFFGLAAKEVVEATAPGGALHTWRRAALPFLAAVGGMIAPAGLYFAYVAATGQSALARGWAIPCATDIAFSALVAKAIFRRHPAIPFLLLLAIADDALGLAILAAFYPVGELHLTTGGLLVAAGMAAAFVFNRRRVKNFWPYVAAAGSLAWLGLFHGGLHPALALVPIVPFVPHAARDPGLFVEAPASARDTLSEFEHWWKYPVQAVLFLFGLVNAGVALRAYGHGTWAVLFAIVIGKPVGIGLSVAAAVLVGFRLPPRLTWRDVVVTGCAAGIGFTVALFFATAAFPAGRLLDEAKLGALLSVSSAVVAFAAAGILRVGRFRASPAEGP